MEKNSREMYLSSLFDYLSGLSTENLKKEFELKCTKPECVLNEEFTACVTDVWRKVEAKRKKQERSSRSSEQISKQREKDAATKRQQRGQRSPERAAADRAKDTARKRENRQAARQLSGA